MTPGAGGVALLAETPLGSALLAWAPGASTPGPTTPELREGLEPGDVTPGVLGFLVIFAVVLACIPLFRSMTSKLRGVEYRGRALEAQEAARSAGAGPVSTDAEPIPGGGSVARDPRDPEPPGDDGAQRG